MTPKRAFQSQRQNAKARGIAFEMTFEEWWSIWKDWFHLRGRGKNGLCMARNGDIGPYAVGNVYITTNLGNVLDVDPAKRRKPPISDDERIAAQHRREMMRSKPTNGDRASHIAYKAHCKSVEDDIGCDPVAP